MILLKIIQLMSGAGICFWGVKFFFAQRYFNYHQEATGISWDEINEKIKLILLVFMKVIGIGSLVVGMFILSFATFEIFHENLTINLITSSMAILFLGGLFGISFFVFKKTKASTPWKRMALWMIMNIGSLITELILN